MNTLKIKMDVLLNLGTGLSVDNLCRACNITYNELCEVASEYPDVMTQLKKWYKRYDFMSTPVKEQPKEEPVKEVVVPAVQESDDKPLETKKKSAKRTKKEIL